MDWSKGFSASYYLTLVDPVTWRDTERIEITSGSVSRTASGLRQSADIDCTSFEPDRERWVRVWLDAAQEGDAAHEALFTGLTSAVETTLNGNRKTIPLACYSVLKPCEDVLLDIGYYIYQGTSVKRALQELLSATPAPVVIEGTPPQLYQTIIAERSENNLSMVNKLLNVIGWRMKIDGDGTIRVGGYDTDPKSSFGIYNDVIEPRVGLKADWFKCPNVFRASCGDLTAIARDDDRNSILSTVNRGREVWKEDTSVKLTEEGLEQYARRRLVEEQAYAYSVSYTRRYDPAVNVSDTVRLHYPEQKLMGEYAVVSQNFTLGHGCPVQEVVQK